MIDWNAVIIIGLIISGLSALVILIVMSVHDYYDRRIKRLIDYAAVEFSSRLASCLILHYQNNAGKINWRIADPTVSSVRERSEDVVKQSLGLTGNEPDPIAAVKAGVERHMKQARKNGKFAKVRK